MPFQAQRDELAASITEWVRKNPGTECHMSNGRGDALLVHAKNLIPGKADKQLKMIMASDGPTTGHGKERDYQAVTGGPDGLACLEIWPQGQEPSGAS
jgi:hypothetical protein